MPIRGQFMLSRGHRQVQSLLRGLNRIVEPPGLGVGGREGLENDRVFAAGERAGLPGQFHRFCSVAQRCLRRSGQQPRQNILDR